MPASSTVPRGTGTRHPVARAFLALTLPESLADRVHEVRRHFPRQTGFRSVPHLTVIPPVESADPADLAAVGAVARACAATEAPFDLTLNGIGYLPRAVYWVVQPSPALTALQQDLSDALASAGSSRGRHRFAFLPHVTVLARRWGHDPDPQQVADVAPRVLGTGWWEVGTVDLHLMAPGVRHYTVAGEHPLGDDRHRGWE